MIFSAAFSRFHPLLPAFSLAGDHLPGHFFIENALFKRPGEEI
jgi:hypothetical protein